LQTGEVSVRAISPVVIAGNCIMNGERSRLKNNEKIMVCEEDMSVAAEYELRLQGWPWYERMKERMHAENMNIHLEESERCFGGFAIIRESWIDRA
jgi:hypothetical protein